MTREQARPRTSVVAAQGLGSGDVATSCARWILAAAGGDAATVRVAVPDAAGRLRVVACEGQPDGSGRLRSRRRRSVYRTRRPVHLPMQGSQAVSLGIFPLVHDGDALGIVEIVAPTATMEQRMDVLAALVGRSALVLAGARVQTEAERALVERSALLKVASELLWVRTATEAVRLAVRASHQHLGTPIAGLLPDRDRWGWFLAATGGLGVRRRSVLRLLLRDTGQEPGPRRMRAPSLRRRFREVSGCREVVAVRAGAAVLLFGDVAPGHADFLDGVGSLLAGVLPRVGPTAAQAGHGSHDLGIAWTAHELKGPLVGARAALEVATETTPWVEGRELLRRTSQELGQLSELIDPLLRWSSGTELLERREVDLVQVARDAVASASFGSGTERISIDAPEELIVRADPRQLRSAISNVVRNSLSYSSEATPVRLRIESDDRSARVVVRDRGPGIPTDVRRKLFDPFTRGRNGHGSAGSGLGLFIARRVLEAHGGAITLRPSKVGATFVLELPVERRLPSAS